MSFTVRPAGEADIPALFAIRTAVRENHMSPDELERACALTPHSRAARRTRWTIFASGSIG